MLRDQPSHHHSILADMILGAISGDFASELGGAGRLTQIIFGFIPGVGTVCALRDLIANWQQKDMIGALLNGLAAIPVIGGVSKFAKVMRAWRLLNKSAIPNSQNMGDYLA